MSKLNLTERQMAAVNHDQGPLLVFAGPGSGKTRVVIERYARLVESGVPLSKILCTTFTNKAADELLARLKLSRRRPDVWVGTMHSIARRWLRMCSSDQRGARSDNFSIYDEGDSEALVRRVLRDIGEPVPRQLEKIGAKHYCEWISEKKTRAEESAACKPQTDEDKFRIAVWLGYEDGLAGSNAFDFDDLLLYGMKAVESKTPSGERLRGLFRYVMVDEFQDVNDVQARMMRAVAANGNIMVVGDFHQSVYAFRGANPSNIREFSSHFPGAKTIMLDTCFRSTKYIVDCANELIRHNPPIAGRTDMLAVKEDGPKVMVRAFSGADDEVKAIVDAVQQNLQRGVAPSEQAIIYRVNSLSSAFEQEFRYRGIKYAVAGTKFYDRAIVKDVLALARLIVNEESEVDFDRMANRPTRGLGRAAMTTLNAVSKIHRQGRVKLVAEKPDLLFEIPHKTVQALQEWLAKIRLGRRMLGNTRASETVKWLMDATGDHKMLQKIYVKAQGKDKLAEEQAFQDLSNAEAVIAAIEGYEKRHEQDGGLESLEGFLNEAALAAADDSMDESRVSLLSGHSAKGKEFDHVWVVAVESGLFPIVHAMTEPEVEEERRLLYVAMTRARSHLQFSYCTWRMRYGKYVDCRPSQMLGELDERCVERLEGGGRGFCSSLSRVDGRGSRMVDSRY